MHPGSTHMSPNEFKMIPNQYSSMGKSLFSRFWKIKNSTWNGRISSPKFRFLTAGPALPRNFIRFPWTTGGPGWVSVVYGAKHSPPTSSQGGPSGNFGGSSCGWFFSSSTQSFHHQKHLQKQKLHFGKGFKPWEIRWWSPFSSICTVSIVTRPTLGSFLAHF